MGFCAAEIGVWPAIRHSPNTPLPGVAGSQEPFVFRRNRKIAVSASALKMRLQEGTVPLSFRVARVEIELSETKTAPTHPIVFLVLCTPFGATSGYVNVRLGYLL